MKERPIIFRAEMVRAILSGAKTQTRRVVKPIHMATVDAEQFPILAMCPYGSPGGHLWVREPWNARPVSEVDSGMYEAWAPYEAIPKQQPSNAWVYFEADGDEDGPWRPSIHMPRWASRITLEITGVRVERLQDISEADAVAEGCKPIRPELMLDGLIVRTGRSAVEEFRLVWEQIHGGRSWEKNPWVWAIEFKKLEQKEQA